MKGQGGRVRGWGDKGEKQERGEDKGERERTEAQESQRRHVLRGESLKTWIHEDQLYYNIK